MQVVMLLEGAAASAFPHFLCDNPYFKVLGMVAEVSYAPYTGRLRDYQALPGMRWLWEDLVNGELRISDSACLAQMLTGSLVEREIPATQSERDSAEEAKKDLVLKKETVVKGGAEVSPSGKAGSGLAWGEFVRRGEGGEWAYRIDSENPYASDKVYVNTGAEPEGLYGPDAKKIGSLVSESLDKASDDGKAIYKKGTTDVVGKYVYTIPPVEAKPEVPAVEAIPETYTTLEVPGKPAVPAVAFKKGSTTTAILGWRIAEETSTATNFYELDADTRLNTLQGQPLWQSRKGNTNKILTRAAVRWVDGWVSVIDDKGVPTGYNPVWKYLESAWVITHAEYMRCDGEFLRVSSGNAEVWRKKETEPPFGTENPDDPSGTYDKISIKVEVPARLESSSSGSSSSDSSSSDSSSSPDVSYSEEYHTTSSVSYSSSSHSSQSYSSASSPSSNSSSSDSSSSSGVYSEQMTVKLRYEKFVKEDVPAEIRTKVKILMGRARAWT